MRSETKKYLESWWAEFLGLDVFPAPESGVLLAHHPGPPNLGGWNGVYVLERSGTVIHSVPPSSPESLTARLSMISLEDLPTLGRVIGPAALFYKDCISSSPSNETLEEITFGDPRIALFRSEVPSEEWDEAGFSENYERIFTRVENGRLLLLTGFERFERVDSRIAHISVLVHPEARNRGWARAAVSSLTNLIIELGLIAQYRAHHQNRASLKVAEALGFEMFAYQYALKDLRID